MANLKVGIIGFGFIGKIHLENLLKMPDIKVQSVFSTIDEREQIPKDISFYTDYKQMINQEDLDVALICTPTFTHEEIACSCAAKGLDIFLEKPMALTIESCDKILDSIKNNNVNLMVGHVLRFWPTYGSVKYYLEENDSILGEILSITGMRFQTFPWSQWFADQTKSGGVILDLSIHDIDYAIWIMGEANSVSWRLSIYSFADSSARYGGIWWLGW